MQFATVLANPVIAGAVGKIVTIGDQRAIQSSDGDVHIVMNNKFLVMVSVSLRERQDGLCARHRSCQAVEDVSGSGRASAVAAVQQSWGEIYIVWPSG